MTTPSTKQLTKRDLARIAHTVARAMIQRERDRRAHDAATRAADRWTRAKARANYTSTE
jgi:hypothetical protein